MCLSLARALAARRKTMIRNKPVPVSCANDIGHPIQGVASPADGYLQQFVGHSVHGEDQ